MTAKMSFALISMVLLLVTTYSSATEIPEGYVSGDWYASGNPYNINGEITIHSDSTLTIHEGVELWFQGHYKLIVNGFLEAIGNEQDSILFTAADTSVGWHGIRFHNAPDSSHLSYCIIQNGQATESDPYGGGIFATNSCLEISHCTVSNNSAITGGGGIALDWESECYIFDCDISGNSGGTFGGGVFCEWETYAPIINCTISGNYAAECGGGLYFRNDGQEYAPPFMQNCTISNNTSDDLGGGVYLEQSCTCFYDCTISDNQSANHGGGIYCCWASSVGVFGCLITRNVSNYGGGILHAGTAFFSIEDCIISDNHANTDYGGIGIVSGWGVSLDRSLIIGNTAEGSGGGVGIENQMTTIEQCTFIANESNTGIGGAICNYSTGVFAFSNILWENSPEQINGNQISITYSNIMGGYSGEGNIDTDPLFVDPENDDYHLQSTNASYHGGLWLPDPEHSPCIDTGNPNSPFEDEPEPNGGRSNMGAYANTSQASLSLVSSVQAFEGKIPTDFALLGAYPNPFNPTTTISFTLPSAEKVNLSIHDISGRLVATLIDGWRDAGGHQVTFDGSMLASGVYFYRFTAGQYEANGKMVLMK